MKRLFHSKSFRILTLVLALLAMMTMPTLAVESGSADPAVAVEEDAGGTNMKAIGVGIAIGLAATGGAIGMSVAVAKSVESIARQPEAESKIRTALMLGLVFIETAIIYALLAAILIIFVL